MAIELDVPDAVRRKAEALGAAGRRWLLDVAALVAELEHEWSIEVGAVLAGGSGALVAAATAAGGVPVVVKLAIPDGLVGHSSFATEVAALQLAAGHGYVEVLAVDERRRALLLEALGPPLSDRGLPVEAQIDVIAATVRAGWRPVPPTAPLRSGAEQAAFLSAFIASAWSDLGRPCPAATVEEAQRFTAARRSAFDPRTAVLVHGDAHPANILAAPGDRGGVHKLIDPDAMVSEPAHDLAFALRDWTDELRAGDPVALGRRWCDRLADRAGVAPDAVWQWAFVERVSTGLFLLRLGDGRGHELLDVATRWTGAGPESGTAAPRPRP